MACTQAIGFIFPIHWSELSTSLKATLRVSDLSFGSLQNKLASLICGLHTSHRIYLSDSLVRTFNFVESHTSCVRFIFPIHYSKRYQTYSIWYRFSIFIFKNLTKGIANTIPIKPKSFPPTARAIIITTGFNLTLCSKTLGDIT